MYGARLGLLRAPRRVAIAVVGSLAVLAGLVLLVTPGPALVVIPVGLAILAVEFEFARRWLEIVRAHVRRVAERAKRSAARR